MKEYPWLSLSTIQRYEPEMRALGVSKVARSPRGFLTAYKRASGNRGNLSEAWRMKRNAFIARPLAQYKRGQTKRRLVLIAWGYDPE